MSSKKSLLSATILVGSLAILWGIVWSQAANTKSVLAGNNCVEPPPGLISWWSGDGSAKDIAGNNDGTLQGGAAFAPGIVGQALSLDGIDDYVSIPFNDNFNFAPDEQFTLELWVKPGRDFNYQAIVVRDVFDWDWGLWQTTNRFLTGHADDNLVGQIDVPIEEWAHVAITYNNGAHNLYVNGILDTLTTPQEPITQSEAGLALGRRVGTYYLGLLDEVTLYNRALAAAEIQAIHAASSAGKCKEFITYLPLVTNPCLGHYLDNFSDSNSGWPSIDSSTRQLAYLNGEYRILLKTADYWSGALPGVQATDFRVSVDVRNAIGVGGTYGILFGMSADSSQFYTFEIDPTSEYVIWRYDNGGWKDLIVDSSSQINTGTAGNRLQIERNGSQIKAFANGQLLTTLTDGSYVGERYIGLITSSYDEANVDIRFDNFEVCSTAGPLNTLEAAQHTFSIPVSQSRDEPSR